MLTDIFEFLFEEGWLRILIKFTCWYVHSWSSIMKQTLFGCRLTCCRNTSAMLLFFLSWLRIIQRTFIYRVIALKKLKMFTLKSFINTYIYILQNFLRFRLSIIKYIFKFYEECLYWKISLHYLKFINFF